MKRKDALVKLLEGCNNFNTLAQLQSQVIKIGLAHDSFLATKLNVLSGKYASLNYARWMFDETPQKSVYLWNSMLKSYCRERKWEEALYLFREMISGGITHEEKPDNFTVPMALKACSRLRAIKCGKMIHGFVKKNDTLGTDIFVGAALIELYSRCGQMDCALGVFEEFSRPDVVMWTSMVTGYEQNGYPEEALAFFSQMVMVERIYPDPVTLISLVSACTQLLDLKLGSCVHCFVIRKGFESDLSLVNSLLNLYAKIGSIKMAANLFRGMQEKDVISWSSMLACYAHNRAAGEALDLFNNMISSGVEPNKITLVSALQACGVAHNLKQGRKIHELASWRGFELDPLVSTALVDMYMKCLSPDEAVDLFERMPQKDVISWAAVLSGYAQNGMADRSMGVFLEMLSNEIIPDAVALVNILSACSELGSFMQASCLHGYVSKCGFDYNIFVAASLIQLYSKCGSLDNAVKIFQGITVRDVVIWSAMIAGYGIHGQGREALKLFDLMLIDSAARPNSITFLSILSACSHAGLVKEGINIFQMMVDKYQIEPSSDHYGILVDLFGRMGNLDVAMDVINGMPIPAEPHVWGALLGACRIHHNVEMGEVATDNILRLDPDHAGYYILLSNIYALEGQWANVAKLKNLLKEKGLKKISGESLIEVSNEVHRFVSGGILQLDSQKTYEILTALEVKLKEEHGFDPDSELLVGSLDF